MEINEFYINNPTEIKNSLSEKKDFPGVTLFDFFEEKYFIKLQKKLRALNYKKEINPLSYSYSQAETNIFNKKIFLSLISKLTDKKIRKLSAQIFSFAWKDYTILHDAVKERGSYEIIIDSTDFWDNKWGGQVIYVDGSSDYWEIPPRRNTLTIIKRKKGLRRFVKYVNNHAGRRKRQLVFMTI